MVKRSISRAPIPQLAPDIVARVHLLVLAWYRVYRRALPWRDTSDPYAILVSEIMLQQTQVERVLPKYEQFLAAFPTLYALATAPTADVISTWVPLGYNSRAVRLQAIARQVLAECSGHIPEAIDDLLRLKGIGRYTAGAIACFAYRQQVATVDTNIYRLLHRVFFGLEQPEAQWTTDQMFLIAEQVLPEGQAYDWNQALMDLGATICTSANPQCLRCPLQSACVASREMSSISLFPGATSLNGLSAHRPLRRVAEKKTAYSTQPFTSTNRYFRGRIVDHLRALPHGQRLALPELGHIIKHGFVEDDLPWLQRLVQGLVKDGLVDASEEGVRLP